MRLFFYEMLCAGGLPSGADASMRAEGWAMLSAFVEDFGRIPDLSVVTLLDAACPRELGHVCRRVFSADEANAFHELACQADATLLIAPEFDDLLATRADWVLQAGGRLLGCSPSAIRLTADKLALARHLRTHQVPTPATQ